MDFYQNSSFAYENGYYTQIPYDSAYYNYSSYNPPPQSPHSSAALWSYEFAPTQSLVAYSNCYDDSYSNSGSIQYSVYHSVANPTSIDEDVDFVEYDPHPYSGGYDISETYGKPLDPSDVICHPRSTLAVAAPSPQKEVTIAPAAPTPAAALPAPTPAAALPAPTPAAPPTPTPADDDEDEEDDEDDFSEEDEEEEDEGDGSSLQVYDERVVNEIPPGYGLAEFDLCENLFGYWPCLSRSRMSEKCGSCGNERVVVVDDFDQWKRTADYLFGNPDPYRGWADEGGYPSGNPVYAYDQMQYYEQPALTMYEKADEYGQNSWFL